MKKILAFISVLVLCVSLSSCYRWKINDDKITADIPQNQVEIDKPEVVENEKVELKLYSIDADMNEEKSVIEIDKNASLQEKTEFLAKELSGKYFNGNQIEIKIEEKTNSAVINLSDSEEKSWYSFFQGSQGGHTTEYRIVKTFLQPEYSGEWVDNIVIYYNGEPAFEMFEHFCLYEKFERSNIENYYSK